MRYRVQIMSGTVYDIWVEADDAEQAQNEAEKLFFDTIKPDARFEHEHLKGDTMGVMSQDEITAAERHQPIDLDNEDEE